jgi:hypothetical protein
VASRRSSYKDRLGGGPFFSTLIQSRGSWASFAALVESASVQAADPGLDCGLTALGDHATRGLAGALARLNSVRANTVRRRSVA